MTDGLLTTRDAATYLGVSKAFLERDRWAGARIPFVRIGTRSIRYRRSELEKYIKRQTRQSTSETCGAQATIRAEPDTNLRTNP